ncbi:MAG: polya polymerase [Desulfobulbaceae bacterium]|nr:polya polymerase [Desulfobulbaceae bacterium]
MTSGKAVDTAQASVHDSCAVLIIPPGKHPITEDQIDRDALFVLKRLSDAGFSGYLVGGGVRDLYLGKKPKDFDISTNAKPGQLRKLFPHSNTIGRRFRLVQVFFKGGKTVEVSTLRSLSEHDLDGPELVLAPNNTFGTLSEDARRRDLTINSLFYEIEKHTIIDYVNGTRDLDKAVVRIVGEPDKRIRRDPVRMMRGIRHAARNDFTIEKKTWQAICSNSKTLNLCPPSRLRDELLKDIYSGASAPWFSLAMDSGIYCTLFPFYQTILENSSQRELLYAIYKTIDRVNALCVNQNVHRQKDFFLLAFTLIPWAETKFQIISTYRKGAPLFNLSKEIREEIDNSIATELNLRRSLRQEMVSLLINLSQLIHNRKKDNWPQWLKKKSYFGKSLLFYRFFMEATTGEQIAPQYICASPKKKAHNTPAPAPSAANNNKQKSKIAFAKNIKGGIFGFKK